MGTSRVCGGAAPNLRSALRFGQDADVGREVGPRIPSPRAGDATVVASTPSHLTGHDAHSTLLTG